MQISYSHGLITIDIEEDAKTFYFLQNLAEKNFSKKIGKKSKIIIFKQDEESVQRRYFLKLISKIYASQSQKPKNSEVENIKNSYDKNIKISLIKSNQILQCVNIDINIEDDYTMTFKLDTNNTILISYLRNYFKNHISHYSSKDKTLNIEPYSSRTARLLEKLLEQKELLGSFIEFNYDKNQYEGYKVFLENKEHNDLINNSLFQILEEHYKVLGCTKKDSFKTIRQKYLKLVKRYHPDTLNSTSTFLNKCYTKKFYNIQNAYKIIKMHFEHERKNLFVA
ncbi:MAG: DnaJ domain-containing protein [Sulfurospirillaceae bacterium]|nr:DnaJ domain-containing protein [Sulfurospirillaceae bacterium]